MTNMDTSYIKAIERKLSKRGLDDDKIQKEIKKILNPKEEEKQIDEVKDEVGQKSKKVV